MKTVLLFYLLVFCGAAKSFTEKLVDLGQNVTLPCEVDEKHVYWFLMKPSERPVSILRSFSSYILDAGYTNLTFRKTFSLKPNSGLFIRNISTNELGLYFCIQADSPPKIGSGIRLYTRNPPTTSVPENQTSKPNLLQRQDKESSLLPFLIVSLIMISALLIAVTVFAVCRCRRSPETREQTPDPGVESNQDNAGPVYSDVTFIQHKSRAKTNNQKSTYALLNLPNR